MTKKFVHLHTHSDYSLLDGAISVKNIVKLAAEDGQPGVAITDHGTMAGTIQLFKHANEAGITPIPGLEAYYVPDTTEIRRQKEEGLSVNRERFHMILLATSDTGYKNLMRIQSEASLNNYHYKPLADDALLEKYHEGIVATSGCLGSAVNKALMAGDFKEAMDIAGRHREIFGVDNYFIEIQNHGIPDQLRILGDQVELAKKMGIPLLATQDSHYGKREDAEMHEAILAMQTGAKLSDETRFKFESDENYMRAAEEMYELFPDSEFPGACSNTLLIEERAREIKSDFTGANQAYLIPTFPTTEGRTEKEQLRDEVLAGARERYGVGRDKSIPEHVMERIDYELGVINDMGFNGYFLMTADIVNAARSKGYLVGPGRGSAPGSIVSYTTGITTVDPIRYGLYFERFLNPGRKSMPDIDIDFEPSSRAEMVQYTIEKYGADRVAKIATYSVFRPKSAIQKAAAILGIASKTGSIISGMWPGKIDQVEAPLWAVMQPESPPEDDPFYHHWRAGRNLRDYIKKNGLEEVMRIAIGVEGVHNNHGTHAAAVLITPEALTNFVPLHRSKKEDDKVPVCEYDKDDTEYIGGLKMDFLGLINLEIIKNAVAAIKRDLGVDIDVDKIPLDDKKTFKMMTDGETDGVFQLVSPGMRRLLTQVKPTSIEDLSAVIALFRPGPMGTGLHEAYAKAKNGIETPYVPHEDMREMFKETHSILCVTGDTMIWDANRGKKVRIDSIEDAVKSGDFYTVGVDSNGSAVSRRVSAFMRSGKKEVVDIKLADNKSIRLSATHPVLTPRGWVNAGDLVVGDMMGAPKSSLPVSRAADGALSIDEARMLGYLLGDGYMTGKVNGVINADEDIIADVKGIAARAFPDVHPVIEMRERSKTVSLRATAEGTGKGKGPRGAKGESIYDNLSVNVWLRSLGFDGSERSRTKFIPEAMFASGDEAIANFIATLWDCDGHVGKRGITFLKTVSEQMAHQVVDLLSILGIKASVQNTGEYVSEKHGLTQSFGVYVFGESFWQTIVPLMVSRKRNVPGHTYTRNTKTIASIEVVESRLHDAINRNRIENGLPPRDTPFGLGAINGYLVRTGSAERLTNTVIINKKKTAFVYISEGLADILRQFPKDDEFERNLAINWSPIESITTDGVEEMFDISVEDVHNFLGNDLILHNCYQEQVMMLSQHYAGYNAQQADDFRKAVGKKDAVKLAQQEKPFKEGVIARGYGEKVANELWDMIPPFAAYAFNKAHSVVYAFLAYWTGWLKANYPAQYAAACIDIQDRDRRTAQVASARKMGVQVFPPNINKSGADSVTSKDSIWLGLNGVRNCGGATLTNILNERARNGQFSSVGDFMVRMSKVGGVNKQSVHHLAAAGAFDGMIGSRLALHTQLEKMMAESKIRAKSQQSSEGLFGLFDDVVADEPLSEFVLDGEEYSLADRISGEIVALGFAAGDHPFALIKALIPAAQTDGKIDPRAIEVGSEELMEGRQVFLYGTVTAHRVRVPKGAGRPQHNFILENDTGEAIDVIWYGGDADSITNGHFAVVGGTFQKRELQDSDGNPYEKEEVKATSVVTSSIDAIMNGANISIGNVSGEEIQRSLANKKRAERRQQNETNEESESGSADSSYEALIAQRRNRNRSLVPDKVETPEAVEEQMKIDFFASSKDELDDLMDAMESMVEGDVLVTLHFGDKKYKSEGGVKISERGAERISRITGARFEIS